MQRIFALWFVTVASAIFSTNAALAAEPVVEDIVFRAKVDDSEQRYVRILPADFNADEPHDLVVVLHGHGSDRWQYVNQPRDECRAARDFAASHQLIFVSPDYRAKTSWMGPQAEADVVQILAEMKEAYKIGHVIISGASMGGTASLTFAALHPDLSDGVVSINGTANLLEYENFQPEISASYGGDKTKAAEEYRRRSAELWPERFTMPLACVTGGADRVVPAASVLRLIEALKKLERPVQLNHLSNGGHETNYADTLDAYEFVFTQLQDAK